MRSAKLHREGMMPQGMESRRSRLRGNRLFDVTVRVPELGIEERLESIKGNDEWHVRTNAMFLCQHKLTGQMVEYDVEEVTE